MLDFFMHSYEIIDIHGNLLSVMNGRRQASFSCHYNMLQSPCYQDSIDSGTQRTLVDAAEQPLYAWDAEDRRTEMIYDELRRPVQKKITENSVTKTLEIYT